MTPQAAGAAPAYPVSAEHDRSVPDGGWGGTGLTKREYFAAMAMQGMVSRDNYSAQDAASGAPKREAMLQARQAIRYADALLAALQDTP